MQNVYKETMRSIINRQAETLYKKMKSTPGFKIADTVEELGGRIEYVQDFEDGVEAKINASEDGQSFIIKCQESIQLNDKYTRFAIAHELGHLFMHMIKFETNDNYKIVGNYTRNPQDVSINEWEAEEFAAAFLMPEGEFRMHVELIRTDDKIKDKIEYLSEHFKVPYKNVITRGKGLGIW